MAIVTTQDNTGSANLNVANGKRGATRNIGEEIQAAKDILNSDPGSKSVLAEVSKTVAKDVNAYNKANPTKTAAEEPVDDTPKADTGGDKTGEKDDSNKVSYQTYSSSLPSTENTYMAQAYANYLNNANKMYDTINTGYEDAMEQLKAANAAATEAATLALNDQLRAGKLSYEQQSAYQEYLKNVSRDNMILQNTAAGNMGGIGQAQYSAQDAAYDQQLLDIQLAIIQLENDTASQIAQLEAQGQYELANELAQLKVQKMDALVNQFNTIESMKANYSSNLDNYSLSKANYDLNVQAQNFNQALNLIQLGASNDSIASALGVDTATANNIANYVNYSNQLGLQVTEQQLKSLVNANGGTTDTDSVLTNHPGMTDTQASEYVTLAAEGNLPIYHETANGSLVLDGYVGSNDLKYLSNGAITQIGGVNYVWNSSAQQWVVQSGQSTVFNTRDNLISSYESATGSTYTDPTSAITKLNTVISDNTKKAKQAAKEAENYRALMNSSASMNSSLLSNLTASEDRSAEVDYYNKMYKLALAESESYSKKANEATKVKAAFQGE